MLAARSVAAVLLLLVSSVAACGARSDLAVARGSTATGTGGCPATEPLCGDACCDGLCLEGACQPILTVADCKRYTPAARPIAVLQASNHEVIDVDLENIALHGGSVYFVSEGRLQRVPATGGAAESVASLAVGESFLPTSLVVGDLGAFYEDAGGVFVARPGQAPVWLAPPTGATYTRRLALTAEDLVFVTANADSTFTFSRVPQQGGAATPLFTSWPGQYQTLTADAETAYVSTTDGLHRLAVDGSSVELLAATPVDAMPAGLAVDDAGLVLSYFDPALGTAQIGRLDKDGGTAHAITAGVAPHIELTADWIYLHGGLPEGEAFHGAIFRVPRAGGGVVRMTETAFSGTPGAWGYNTSALAVGGGQVFFIEHCQADGEDYGTYRLVTLPVGWAP